MTLEASECHTVSTPRVLMDKPDTLAAYQANVATRFGNGTLPSWQELARRENAARRRMVGLPSQAKPQGSVSLMRDDAWERRRLDKLRETLRAKTRFTRERILSALHGEATAADVATAINMDQHAVRAHLGQMLADGMVLRRMVKRTAIWQRALEEVA